MKRKDQIIYKYNVTGITRNSSRLHPRWFSHCQTFCKRLYNVCPNSGPYPYRTGPGTSLRLSLLSILPLSGLLQEPGAGCGLTQRVGRPQEPDKGTARPPRPHTARIGSKEYQQIRFQTRSLAVFNQFHDLFYLNGVKVIPAIIVELLTPRALAFWAMDDGTRHSTGYGFYLCTHCRAVPYKDRHRPLQSMSAAFFVQFLRPTLVWFVLFTLTVGNHGFTSGQGRWTNSSP